jgi:hypothetical protein
MESVGRIVTHSYSMVYSVIEIIFDKKIPKNSFNVSNFIENRKKLRKIPNKFPWISF